MSDLESESDSMGHGIDRTWCSLDDACCSEAGGTLGERVYVDDQLRSTEDGVIAGGEGGCPGMCVSAGNCYAEPLEGLDTWNVSATTLAL